MTQGTKIGLLVSLAFLIVIFVLLSDHAVSTSDAKPAQVTVAGPQVQKGIATPGAVGGPAIEAPTETAAVPFQQVPTGDEMAARTQPGVARVSVGPAQTNAVEVTDARANSSLPVTHQPIQIGPGASVRTLADLGAGAMAAKDEFVPVDRIGASSGTDATAAQLPKMQEHKAVPGDTVSRMARKFYGEDTKPLRDLIVAANKSLKGDPNRIEVGKVYVIPPKPVPPTQAGASAAAAVAANGAVPALAAASNTVGADQHSATTQPAAATAAPAERIYVVKQGDNLWKIAKEQCKDGNMADQIKKLNRDVLKNGTDLKIGTKLRLPTSKES